MKISPGKDLTQTHHLPEATQEAEAAVKADLKSPSAHEVLGQIMAQKGQMALARAEFESALRLAPGFGPAQLDLAQILMMNGDSRAAINLLQQAEHSSAPEIVNHAHAMLQQLGAHE
jgi:Flp pilus assembly protein TadD